MAKDLPPVPPSIVPPGAPRTAAPGAAPAPQPLRTAFDQAPVDTLKTRDLANRTRQSLAGSLKNLAATVATVEEALKAAGDTKAAAHLALEGLQVATLEEFLSLARPVLAKFITPAA